MKRFNKNIFVFVFFVVFIVVGIWGHCFEQLKSKTIDLAAGIKHGNISRFFDYKCDVDDISNKGLSYHNEMMDINSIKDNLLGTRVVIKDDTTIVRADSGSLIESVKKLDSEEIKKVVSAIYDLKTVSENNGANFLYCAVPSKEYYQKSPLNIDNYFIENYNAFISELGNNKIPFIDFSNMLTENISNFNTYYNTDHHWTVRAGFEANNALLKELNSRYGFNYFNQYTDINNYDITYYPNWFLGSKGKKVGTFFTWNGVDDFELITPKFKTDMTEEQPAKNQIRNGEFKDTVLYMENMEKDYYKNNTFATYSGGDFRLQIMYNNLNPKGKKILMIRNSFSCVVAPFLSLQTSELHICDMRDYEYYVGDKINAEEYIKQIAPDYVIVLYNGVSCLEDSHGKYNFF